MNKLKTMMPLVFIDVETTGLYPHKGHRVIEIGAIAMEGGHLLTEYHSFVKTSRTIPAQASKIHGITKDMLHDQPTPEEVYPALKEFIKDRDLVAHNAKFDTAFLRHEFARLGMGMNNRSICTLEMARRKLPHLSDHKLGTVYDHLFRPSERQMGTCSGSPKGSERVPGARMMKPHRALADARMVAAIWLIMEKERWK